MKYFLFLFLFLSVGWLHCRSQRVAVSVNALPAIDGAFEAGVEKAGFHRIGCGILCEDSFRSAHPQIAEGSYI